MGRKANSETSRRSRVAGREVVPASVMVIGTCLGNWSRFAKGEYGYSTNDVAREQKVGNTSKKHHAALEPCNEHLHNTPKTRAVPKPRLRYVAFRNHPLGEFFLIDFGYLDLVAHRKGNPCAIVRSPISLTFSRYGSPLKDAHVCHSDVWLAEDRSRHRGSRPCLSRGGSSSITITHLPSAR